MVSEGHVLTCVTEAGKELRMRTKMRDSWLKTHLLGQAAIAGLALGIKSDLTIGQPAPAYAALAPALSIMFCLFHGVQDDLVAGISRYLKSISVAAGSDCIPTWHGSTMIHDFYAAGWAPGMKLTGLIFAFVVIPGILAVYSISAIQKNPALVWMEVTWSSVLLSAALTVCIICYSRRKDLGMPGSPDTAATDSMLGS